MNAGRPELVTIDEAPEDAWIATAAAIGAPAGTTDWEMRGVDYVKAVQLVQEALGAPIYGLMIGQNGKSSTLNGWLPSAILGVKVIDAVGDIRAHPTGDMGSIGLANSPETMIQSAVGGNRAKGEYIELVVRGATAKISPILRTLPTCPAASSPRAATRSARPMSAGTRRWGEFRSRSCWERRFWRPSRRAGPL